MDPNGFRLDLDMIGVDLLELDGDGASAGVGAAGRAVDGVPAFTTRAVTTKLMLVSGESGMTFCDTTQEQ